MSVCASSRLTPYFRSRACFASSASRRSRAKVFTCASKNSTAPGLVRMRTYWSRYSFTSTSSTLAAYAESLAVIMSRIKFVFSTGDTFNCLPSV